MHAFRRFERHPRDRRNSAASLAFNLDSDFKAGRLAANKARHMRLRTVDPRAKVGLRDVVVSEVFGECHHA